MQSEYVYPDVGDRTSPKEWQERDQPVLMEQANQRVEQMLSTHFPEHVSAEVDARIREQFPVKLPRELMTASKPVTRQPGLSQVTPVE